MRSRIKLEKEEVLRPTHSLSEALPCPLYWLVFASTLLFPYVPSMISTRPLWRTSGCRTRCCPDLTYSSSCWIRWTLSRIGRSRTTSLGCTVTGHPGSRMAMVRPWEERGREGNQSRSCYIRPNWEGGGCQGWWQRCPSLLGYLPFLLTGDYSKVCLLSVSGSGNTFKHLVGQVVPPALLVTSTCLFPYGPCFVSLVSLPSCVIEEVISPRLSSFLLSQLGCSSYAFG